MIPEPETNQDILSLYSCYWWVFWSPAQHAEAEEWDVLVGSMDLDAHPINLWDTQIGCGFVVVLHVRLVLKRLVCWDISSPKLTVCPEKRPSETGNFIFQLPTIIFSSGTLFFLRECILFCSMDVFPGERWAWYYKTPIPRQQLYLVDSSGIFPANELW